MAQKKITDLQLIDALNDTLNIPIDDSIQSYRMTSLQMKNWILANGNISRPMLAQGAIARGNFDAYTTTQTLSIDNDLVSANASGGAFTITFPTSGMTGKVITVRKTDSTYNVVTLSAGGTFGQLKYPDETIKAYYTGSSWQIISRSFEPFKCQRKLLASNVTSISGATTITGLGLSNLKVGQWYKVEARVEAQSDSSGPDFVLNLMHNSAIVSQFRDRRSGLGAARSEFICHLDYEFSAVATTMTVETPASLGGTWQINGNGTIRSCIFITEIPWKLDGSYF